MLGGMFQDVVHLRPVKAQPWLKLLQTRGGLAQLVERLHGMQEVIGSTPLSSTKAWF